MAFLSRLCSFWGAFEVIGSCRALYCSGVGDFFGSYQQLSCQNVVTRFGNKLIITAKIDWMHGNYR